MLENIKTIGIAGSGLMGYGIAIVALQHNFNVVLYDLFPDALKNAENQINSFFQKSLEKGKITQVEIDSFSILYTSNLNELKADLIIEAILEKLDIKQDLFAKLEEVNNNNTILATNTSSIPITQIASKLKRPENCVGMHFFNPAPLMKLVEVIQGEATSTEISQLIYDLALKMNKTPVFAKDAPGFIVNRVARHFYLESLQILEEGITDVKDIDFLLENSGFKMGAFKLMDLIGIDTNHEVTKSLYNSFFQDAKFRPSRVQQKKVEAGHFGKKTGKGFYNY